MNEKMTYNELSSASISDKRSIVISECSAGGFTLAQQMIVEEGNIKTKLFLKNAIHIDGINNLYELRDALNMAIDKIEKK